MASEKQDQRETFAIERIAFFSDAVVAIAITLLAIAIRIPELGDGDVSAPLLAALGDLWPHYLSFVVSFMVIGVNWMVHHRLFNYIERYDTRLMWLNMLFLFCIAALPFTSSIMGEYGDTPVAATVYALSVAATGLSTSLLWQYAARHHFLAPDVTPDQVRHSTMRGLVTPITFLSSIPFIWLIGPWVGYVVWGIIPLVLRFIRSSTNRA